MQIEGAVALVTGANRGLGKVFAQTLLRAGAARVYAGARDPRTIVGPGLIPVKLDVTDPGDIAAAVAKAGDVSLLINNAGIMERSSMLAPTAAAALRREMEVNVFGMQAMIQAFAPVLRANGGGAIINMLSVVSWFVNPFNATYCASKHAALAVSDAARIELKGQGTAVIGVHAGFIDTDMADAVTGPKTPAAQVVDRSLEALRQNRSVVFADQRSEEIWQASRTDPTGLAQRMQAMWDAGTPPWAAPSA